MLRLAPPGFERFLQTPHVRGNFRRRRSQCRRGAGAVSACRRVRDAAAAQAIPSPTPCIGELRRFGVDTSRIVRAQGAHGHLLPGDGRQPAAFQGGLRPRIQRHRPGQAGRHRLGRARSTAPAGSTSPASRRPSARPPRTWRWKRCATAREKGLTVSCDLNYRKNLWKWGKPAVEVMRQLVALVDIAIANEEDVQMALGIAGRRGRALRQARPARNTEADRQAC